MRIRERWRALTRRLAPVSAAGLTLLSLVLLVHAGAVAVGNVGAQWGYFTATSDGSCGRGGCVFDGTWVGDDGERMASAEMEKDGFAPGRTARAARPSVTSPLFPSAVYSPWRLRLEPLFFTLASLCLAATARATWRERRWSTTFDGGRHFAADYRPRHGLGSTRAATYGQSASSHAQAGASPSSR